MKEEKSGHKSILIPSSLFKRLENIASQMGLEPQVLAVDILRKSLSEIEAKNKMVITEEERREIKRRLKELGYL